MVNSTIITAFAAVMAIIPSAAFVAPIPSRTLGTSVETCCATTMSMSGPSNDSSPAMHKLAATAAIAGFCILGNVLTANVAFAADNAQLDFGPTSTIIAGRGGGGRGGGRAMGGGGRSMGGGGGMSRGGASYARPTGGGGGGGTTVINRTYISRPGIGISPFGYGMGYGYNPLGGIGLGYGLGAAGNIGNEIRDNRQEGEIQQERYELEAAKAKAAQLEARLALLEQQSGAPQSAVQAPALTQ